MCKIGLNGFAVNCVWKFPFKFSAVNFSVVKSLKQSKRFALTFCTAIAQTEAKVIELYLGEHKKVVPKHSHAPVNWLFCYSFRFFFIVVENELKKCMHKCNECIYIQIVLCRCARRFVWTGIIDA